jgi:hypothetical protein
VAAGPPPRGADPRRAVRRAPALPPLSGAHRWTVDFEAPRDWKAGTYRIVTEGAAAGLVQTYEVASAPFAVAPSPSLRLTELSRSGDEVSAVLAYWQRVA